MKKNISTIQTGNAKLDSVNTRGWFVGHFLPETCGLRSTDDVEIKWAHHEAGVVRDAWVTGETRTTITILISGKMNMEFRDKTVVLEKPGDYVIWGPGVDHNRKTVEEGLVLVVRWPSVDLTPK